MSGTHFIVGGSFEDKYVIGFLVEAISRKYVPLIFEIIIPFYRSLRNNYKEIFITLEYFNRMIVFSEPIIDTEISILTELYSQFYFSHEVLFNVGHSFGGTMMKGISYYTDIRGIAFESSDAENTVSNVFNKSFKKSINGTNKMINFYTGKNLFS